VRKRISEEEAKSIKAGDAYALHTEISASVLIGMGIDFESQQ
jgi:hypothetical protein